MGRKTLGGTFWSYAAFYTGKLLVFISTVILARLLSQDDFGVAGYALVVISFLEVFYDLGIGTALIYYPEDAETTNTAFWLGVMISAVLYVATWAAGPLFGSYFKDPRAIEVTRWLALTFPITALGNVHSVILSKQLQFRKKFIPEFAKALSKGLISIGMALLGFGAMSLIAGQLAGALAAVAAYWWITPWRPTFYFSARRMRDLLAYGGNIVAVNLISVIQHNTDYLLIGRFLGSALLGVYTLAFRIPDLLILQFCSIISQVIFPVYARMREDTHALQRGFLVTTRYLSLITTPIALGVAAVASPLILVLFSAKWMDAIPVLRAISVYALLISLAYNAGDVYKAQGRPAVLTRVSLIEAAVDVPVLIWAAMVPGTIVAIGWALAGLALFKAVLELSVAAHMLETPVIRIVKAVQPALLSGGLMCGAVLLVLVPLQSAHPIVQLVIGVLVGALVYPGMLWLLNRELVLNTLRLMRQIIRRDSDAPFDDPTLP